MGNPCGRPAPCVECSEVKPIRAHRMCSTCYHRMWHRERRQGRPYRKASIRTAKPKPQQKLYPQAIVWVPGVTGWGHL